MEGMRKIAAAYYERSDESWKKAAEAFFRELNVNRDNKVSLAELKRKKCIPAWISNERVFRELDENGDGTLDFGEVLVVYYILNKTELTTCSECRELLSGTYFGCQLCADDGVDYSLCSGCYSHYSVTIIHDHPYSCLIDNHSLLARFRSRAKIAQQTGCIDEDKERRKREMEELMAITKAHYEGESPKVRGLAREFFVSMDTNGDGKVDLWEFLDFMRSKGHGHRLMRNLDFFSELDHDSNGVLDFFEVMRLFYIMKSGRPFCDSCNNFIPGIFFSCVDCFMTPYKTTFNLCRGCYQTGDYNHDHSQFRDNYTLLEATRNSVLGNAFSTASLTSSTAIVPTQNHSMVLVHAPPTPHATPQLSPSPSANSSNAIVVAGEAPSAHKWVKVGAALQALSVALQIASLPSGCTVM